MSKCSDPAVDPAGVGAKTPPGSGSIIIIGVITPPGVGVKKIIRGHDPGGVGVKWKLPGS